MKCSICEEVKLESVIRLEKDGFIIDGKFAFHMQDTHGIPVDLLPEIFRSVLLSRRE